MFLALLAGPALAQVAAPAQGANPSAADQAAAPAAAGEATGPAPAADSADPVPAEEPPTVDPEILQAPVDDSFLRQLWEARASGFYNLAVEVSNSVESITKAGSLSDQLSSANLELTRLMRLFQISRAYPAQQEDLLRQMRGLRIKISQELSNLEVQKTLLTQRLEEAESLKKDMAGLVFDEKSNLVPKKSLEEAVKILETTDHALNSVLEPGRILQKNLDAAIANIEKDIPQTWRNYYLTSLSASGQGFGIATNVDLIFKWAKSMTSMSLFIWPQTAADRLGALIKFLVTLGVASLLAEVARRAFGKSKLTWKEDLGKVVKDSWMWLVFGVAFLVSSLNSLGGSYLALKLPG
ncbi:MAG: hypothetical protein LBE01_05915, partial [Deltaproteobacteria bacterium]|nr:hypothetical protein [Deltaproteobacteria bacterium]